MANHNKLENISPSASKSNALNANAQAFIPSPITSTSPSTSSPCGDNETPCFSKSKLETIQESPSNTPLLRSKPAPITHQTQLPISQFQTQFPFNPLSLPQFYANQMNDTLALIPAMDQNGLLVMIPPSLVTPGSLFTPIMNVPQPLLSTEHDDAPMYTYMEIDSNQHPIHDKYQNIDDLKREISEKYHSDTIHSLPKPINNKYSNTFLLRTAQILDKNNTKIDTHIDDDILESVPNELKFLVSTHNDEITAECDPILPNALNPFLISPYQPIADMQSLLFMNNYPSITPQFFPMNCYNLTEEPIAPAITPKRRKKYGGNNYKLPPRFQTKCATIDRMDGGGDDDNESLQSESQQVLDHKVVYLVEGGNKSNGGFAQYSLSPTPSRQSSPKPYGPERCKQSLTGMKFEGRRNREVHECFKDNPDLFAKGGYESVMNKINYQIPKIMRKMNIKDDKSLHKTLSGILNKLTPQKFNHLLNITVHIVSDIYAAQLSVIACVFHSVIIREKPLVRLYADFLMKMSQRIDISYNNECLLDLVLHLIWNQLDNQYIEHDEFCSEDDDGNKDSLCEEYNNWLHRLYGNYVLLTELYCYNNDLFEYKRLDLMIKELILMNKEWTWNIVYVILIFHGVALHKIETSALEEYLESIDDLVDGIHYKECNNEKYAHIPLRIKYLLMDVQEHIESTNGKNVNLAMEHRGFMNPKKLNEIHGEFCKENNMTQEQLRQLLSLSKIESVSGRNGSGRRDIQHHHQQHTHSQKSQQYLRRFAPQQNEYPWHTPPRFQRMRQQQRAQNRKKKENKHQKKERMRMDHVQIKPLPLPLALPMKAHGPLYLRNVHVPAPPSRCPPPPPQPQPQPQPPTLTAACPCPCPIPQVQVQVQNIAIKVVNKHKKKKKKKENSNWKEKESHNNGWSTVKRSNKMNKKKNNIVINKKMSKIQVKQVVVSQTQTHHHHRCKKKEMEREKQRQKQKQQKAMEREEKEKEKEKEREKEKTEEEADEKERTITERRKIKNKRKKKKKKAKKKKKQKKKEGGMANVNNCGEYDDEKECKIGSNNLDCDDEDDYDSSDDEIWCETTESYEEDDIVPAFLFGAENETERIEELETALFCEYIDDDDDCDDDEEDGIDDDLDDEKAAESLIMNLNDVNSCNANGEIVDIINRYLETGNEDEAFLYFDKGRNNKNCSRDKDLFIANCIKLYISKGLMDNRKCQYDLIEIERLFVRQMYYNCILHKRNYLHSLVMLSEYIDGLSNLQQLSKIFVIFIENRILSITDIANTLHFEAKCSKTPDILYFLTKHLMHHQVSHPLKLKALLKETKQIKFIQFKINKICNELNIDYSRINV